MSNRENHLARAGREFLSPSTPFLPAPPERFGILRNAAGVPLKKGSRIFNYSPPDRILQIFGSGQRGLLAAPAGAARKEFSRKIKRRNEIKRGDFFGNEAVRSNFSPSIPPKAELRRFFNPLAEQLLLTHAKIYEHNITTNKIFSLYP